MHKVNAAPQLLLAIVVAMPAGCGGGSGPAVPPPLAASDVNLVFVVTEDTAPVA